MKKEPSKAWLEFRAKAGVRLKGFGRNAAAATKKGFAALVRLLAAGLRRAWSWVRTSFSLEGRRTLEIINNGLFARNPLLVLTLGVTCALGGTEDLRSAVALGCCALGVLLCTELLVSLLRNVLPRRTLWLCSLAITAGAATAAGLVLQVADPASAEKLGIYLPLLAVNCAILSRVEPFAARNTPGYAIVDALSCGLGYGLGLAGLGALREILGAGTLWGKSVFSGSFHPVLLLCAPCGGFLVLGLLAAAAQWLKNLAARIGGVEK